MIDFVQYKQIIENCFSIIEEELYDEEPISCKLYGFCEQNGHNSVACNFAGDIKRIRNYLSTLLLINEILEQQNDLEQCCSPCLLKRIRDYLSIDEDYIVHNFEMYFMILNIIVERIDFVITELLKIPGNYKEEIMFSNKEFDIFTQIKRWTNFVKHPKFFILTHHPEYYVNSDINKFECSEDNCVKIDNEFVNTYYQKCDKNDSTYKELEKIIGNKNNVIVVFPDFESITRDFCYTYKQFIEKIILQNDVYQYKLNNISVICMQDDENS